MAIEIFALSVNVSASQWERLSSSFQASTRGVIEYGSSESNICGSVRSVSYMSKACCLTHFGKDTRSLSLKCPAVGRRSSNIIYSTRKLDKINSSVVTCLRTQAKEVTTTTKIGYTKKCSLLTRVSMTKNDALISEGSLLGQEKVGVLLLNLGGPETLGDVQPFLFNLFADPDIIRLPRLFRFLQTPLAQLISVLRAPKSKEGYAAIGGGSPLRKTTEEQV